MARPEVTGKRLATGAPAVVPEVSPHGPSETEPEEPHLLALAAGAPAVVPAASPRGPPAGPESCLFLTGKQLASRWAVSEYHVYDMRRRGFGPRFNIFGRAAVRYAHDAVEEFERSESFSSQAEVWSRRSGAARVRASKRKALAKGRAVQEEARRSG
jgi:hypothetical protein